MCRIDFCWLFAAFCVCFSLSAASRCSAQVSSDQGGPEIHDDQRVTFRLHANRAAEVALRGQWSQETIRLSRGEEENSPWTVTVGPIPGGVWEYSFVVDGLTIMDPTNPAIKPQREPSRSILHVVSKPAREWDYQDIPHGSIHYHDYTSKALGRRRSLMVYTPPGYEKEAASRYPLLVLQHGSGDNHRTWVEHGKANWILDSLIASGKARPMIIMMLDGHPMGSVPRGDAKARETSLDAFQRELFEDALPLVEATYRLSDGADQRAIAGLSMGGWQSVNVGLKNIDRFHWVGSFSGAADKSTLADVFTQASNINKNAKLIWIACGKNDFLLDMNQTLVGAMKEADIHHEWHLTEGDHSWPVWRTYLVEFLPKLFR